MNELYFEGGSILSVARSCSYLPKKALFFHGEAAAILLTHGGG